MKSRSRSAPKPGNARQLPSDSGGEVKLPGTCSASVLPSKDTDDLTAPSPATGRVLGSCGQRDDQGKAQVDPPGGTNQCDGQIATSRPEHRNGNSSYDHKQVQQGKNDRNSSSSLSKPQTNSKIVSMRDGGECLVKASVVLHIYNLPPGSPITPIYTDAVVTVVTSSRHHPKHGEQRENTDVRLTYNSGGHIVVLETPYIESGIYRVVTSSCPKPHPLFDSATVQQARFVSHRTTDDMPANSHYLVIGDICQVPAPGTQRATCAKSQQLSDFLETHNFRTYTLPLLLGHGERNVWAEIEGCRDAEAVFLRKRLEYEQWAWLENLRLPQQRPASIAKPRTFVEPDTIPTDVPFCEHIYRTYISGRPEKPDCPDHVGERSVVAGCEKTIPLISDSEMVTEKPLSDSATKQTEFDAAKSVKRTKRKISPFEKSGRLVLNVKSLCGSPQGKKKKRTLPKAISYTPSSDKRKPVSGIDDDEVIVLDTEDVPNGADEMKRMCEIETDPDMSKCSKRQCIPNTASLCVHSKRERKIRVVCACPGCKRCAQTQSRHTNSKPTKPTEISVDKTK